jgi:hypothetical protein
MAKSRLWRWSSGVSLVPYVTTTGACNRLRWRWELIACSNSSVNLTYKRRFESRAAFMSYIPLMHQPAGGIHGRLFPLHAATGSTGSAFSLKGRVRDHRSAIPMARTDAQPLRWEGLHNQ